MAKLTVKNVGPIREAELEVKKHTVFIGPQGTGKSTLAKLIAVCSVRENSDIEESLLSNYNIQSYVKKKSFASFSTLSVRRELRHNKFHAFSTTEAIKDLNIIDSLSKETAEIIKLHKSVSKVIKDLNPYVNDETTKLVMDKKTLELFRELQTRVKKATEETDEVIRKTNMVRALYIPAERTLVSILSNSLWNLIKSNISLPEIVTTFAGFFEEARIKAKLDIHFLDLSYINRGGIDTLLNKGGGSVILDQSASGYQSIIPLLLVVEHQRRKYLRRFIIEEPELNLYPTAQKDLIYSLMGGLQPGVTYQDAEWVITTHSPYVLSSFNTLMLAYKVAQRSEELRTAVEKIIPARCWINPDEFAAYYVDKGTVRSIISEKTGLIADNELDDVSEDLAGEQDQLLELSRSVPRA